MSKKVTRRIVGTLVIASISACAGLIVIGTALAAPSGPAKAVPHSVAGYWGYNCTICHEPFGGMVPTEADHIGRTRDTCMTCHDSAPAAPAAIAAPAVPAAPAAPAADQPAADQVDAAPAPQDIAAPEQAQADAAPVPQDIAAPEPTQADAAPAPAAAPAPPAPASAPAAASADGASKVTHAVAGRENCLMCHQAGGGVVPAPAGHAGRASSSCLACHSS